MTLRSLKLGTIALTFLYFTFLNSWQIRAQQVENSLQTDTPICHHKEGHKDRIPVIKPRNLQRSSSCSNVSNFVPSYDADMPNAAKTAFDYAIDILEDLIISDVNIHVNVTWEDIPGNAIGFAGASFWRANLGFLPSNNTWYPEPLVNLYNGAQYSGNSDIEVTLDSSANFYFGTDANPAWNQIDLVTVILHEISHGLGFAGSASTNGTPSGTTIGWNGWPNIYDLNVYNGSNTAILDLPNNSQTLLNALIGDDLYSNDIYGNGSNLGTPPQLKADSPWLQGSSFSHLDAQYVGEAMRSFVVTGDAIHTLDTLGISILRDIGWEVCADNCPEEFSEDNNNPLTGQQSYSAAFESDGIIETSQTIGSGKTVIYDSGDSVEINPGFTLSANASIEVLATGCGSN